MGIRTQIEVKPVGTGEETKQGVTIIVDNGGGGGGTFDANVYFQYDGSVFGLVPSTPAAKNPDPTESSNKQQGNGPTMEMTWLDATITWTHDKGPPVKDTGTKFHVNLKYAGTPANSTVTAWAWELKDGKENSKSNVCEYTIDKPKP